MNKIPLLRLLCLLKLVFNYNFPILAAGANDFCLTMNKDQIQEAQRLWKNVAESLSQLDEKKKKKKEKIPKIIHYIWFGTVLSNKTYLERIKANLRNNPDYQFYLWYSHKQLRDDLSMPEALLTAEDEERMAAAAARKVQDQYTRERLEAMLVERYPKLDLATTKKYLDGSLNELMDNYLKELQEFEKGVLRRERLEEIAASKRYRKYLEEDGKDFNKQVQDNIDELSGELGAFQNIKIVPMESLVLQAPDKSTRKMAEKSLAHIYREINLPNKSHRNYAAGSDILRSLLLVLYGGVYLDADIVSKGSFGQLEASHGQLIHMTSTRTDGIMINNDIIASPPGGKNAKEIHESIMKNYDNLYKKSLKRSKINEDRNDVLLQMAILRAESKATLGMKEFNEGFSEKLQALSGKLGELYAHRAGRLAANRLAPRVMSTLEISGPAVYFNQFKKACTSWWKRSTKREIMNCIKDKFAFPTSKAETGEFAGNWY